jgi:broad specificity phosphatase PhoE
MVATPAREVLDRLLLNDSADPPLSSAGEQRAETLATLLRDVGVTAIYSTEYQRTLKTAEPLARVLGLTVNRVARQTESFIGSLRSRHPHDVVLIVGHSNTVPDMLRWLGHQTAVTIADDEYTSLFVVVPSSPGPPAVLRLRF